MPGFWMIQISRFGKKKVSLKGLPSTVQYKYALYDEKENKILAYENGPNRVMEISASEEKQTFVVKTDLRFRFPQGFWRGAGVAVPVFSLRSQEGWGVGRISGYYPLG